MLTREKVKLRTNSIACQKTAWQSGVHSKLTAQSYTTFSLEIKKRLDFFQP